MADKAELVRQLMKRAFAERNARLEAALERDWADLPPSAAPSPDINCLSPETNCVTPDNGTLPAPEPGMQLITLNARLWKDLTMEHFRLSEKQWKLYFAQLIDAKVVMAETERVVLGKEQE